MSFVVSECSACKDLEMAASSTHGTAKGCKEPALALLCGKNALHCMQGLREG